MSIKQKIEQDLKTALLGGDKDAAMVLRGLKSAILNAEIASGNREAGLPEAEVITVLKKEAKARQDSADMYVKGNSQERADKELTEKAIIEQYLPEQLSDEKLEAIVDDVLADMGDVTPQAMGQVIGKVKQKVGGAADGVRIAAIVKGKIG